MTTERAPRANRVPVPAEEPLIGDALYDYADSFEIRAREPEERSAEQLARLALEQSPRFVRWTILFAQRYLLRLRLGPWSSPHHILGWTIVTSRPDVIHLEATSPLLGRGVLVGRKTDPTRVVFSTYVFYARPAARLAWAIVSPIHRIVARVLLERTAAAAQTASTAP
jgi:hypothetical protein